MYHYQVNWIITYPNFRSATSHTIDFSTANYETVEIMKGGFENMQARGEIGGLLIIQLDNKTRPA